MSAWLTAVILAAVVLGTASAGAQTPTQNSTDCGRSTTTAPPPPATATEKGPDSGSKNMGTTGWSGGMRDPGAGTSADKKSTGTDQPATAKGVDPTNSARNSPSAC